MLSVVQTRLVHAFWTWKRFEDVLLITSFPFVILVKKPLPVRNISIPLRCAPQWSAIIFISVLSGAKTTGFQSILFSQRRHEKTLPKNSHEPASYTTRFTRKLFLSGYMTIYKSAAGTRFAWRTYREDLALPDILGHSHCYFRKKTSYYSTPKYLVTLPAILTFISKKLFCFRVNEWKFYFSKLHFKFLRRSVQCSFYVQKNFKDAESNLSQRRYGFRKACQTASWAANAMQFSNTASKLINNKEPIL